MFDELETEDNLEPSKPRSPLRWQDLLVVGIAFVQHVTVDVAEALDKVGMLLAADSNYKRGQKEFEDDARADIERIAETGGDD